MNTQLLSQYLHNISNQWVPNTLFQTSSPASGWNNCKQGDILLYITGYICKPNSILHKKTVLAACQCARLSLKYILTNEKRPLIAIETAEKWANGKATLKEVIKAEEDCWKAYNELWTAAANCAAAATGRSTGATAGAAAATFAARGAARRDHAAATACRAAGAASPEDAARARAAGDYDKEYDRILAECAEIVRKIISFKEVEEAAIKEIRQEQANKALEL